MRVQVSSENEQVKRKMSSKEMDVQLSIEECIDICIIIYREGWITGHVEKDEQVYREG